MPKEELDKKKAKQYLYWESMAKMVKHPDAKITGGDAPKFLLNALKPAEERVGKAQLMREGLRQIVKTRLENISQRRKMSETLSNMGNV